MEPEIEIHREVDSKKPLIIIALVLGVALIGVYGFIQQIVFGIPFGNNPGPDWLMYVLLAICGFALPLIIFSFKLQVQVTDRAVHVKLFPIRNRIIPLCEIESVEAIEYHPLREYGGWGLRRSFQGSAYTMRGNQGVKLKLRNGPTLMIGSQDPELLAKAISRAKGTVT